MSGPVADDLAARLRRLDVWAADPAVYEAVRQLAASGQWKDGLDRARAAIRGGADKVRVLLGLAQGALDGGRSDRALKALEQLPEEALAAGEGLRLRVRAVAASGDAAGALALVEARRAADPNDPDLAALDAVIRPAAGVRGLLPLESERRVRALLEAGEPGRALRVARRLRLDAPDDAGLADLARACAEALDGVLDSLDDVAVTLPMPELEIDLVELM